jgi:hypothetical protein
MNDLIKEELVNIEKEIDRLEDIVEKKDEEHYKKYENPQRDFSKLHEQYQEFLDNKEPEQSQLRTLYRRQRYIKPYKLSEIPNFGTVMTLDEFIGNVKCGGFINYDGFGRYIKDDMETNIEIYPSDVKNKSIRKEFDRIIWFNR